jgi:pSer/pThr/pTyr-binding forkhead associated (FHA) protein
MPKISVMLDEVVINEISLTKERTTIGRRPYNDVVMDNPTVSGEHAILIKTGDQVVIEDLHSTNGTYIGGKAVKQQVLRDGDLMELGKYKIKYDAEVSNGDYEKTMLFKPRSSAAPMAASAPATAPTPSPMPAEPAPELHGAIKVLTGPAAGREMVLTKVVTTVGKPGVSVAAITKRRSSFLVHHVEGTDRLTLNGIAVGEEPAVLKHGDRIMLAGTEMQFLQS